MKKAKEKIADLKKRENPCVSTAYELLDSWGMSLEKRSPGVAYTDHNGNPITDLDLAAFLSELGNRRAVINLPEYKTRRAATVTEGEVVTSKENRHGRVMGLTSNQKLWSFSIMVEDANVMTTDSVGKPRNFMMQDITGVWHDGWKEIELLPIGLDKEVFDKLSGKDGKLRFKDFIHPMRWTSVYGQYFLLAKFLADYRIADELKFLKKVAKEMRAQLEPQGDVKKKVWPKSAVVGATKDEYVDAYESKLDGVELSGEYPNKYPCTAEGLKEVETHAAVLRKLQKTLRFHVRASEFSFWKHIQKSGVGDVTKSAKPVWAKTKDWDCGFKEKPKAQIIWNRFEVAVGIHYRWRTYQKKEKVAA